jgi:hypothetical protein
MAILRAAPRGVLFSGKLATVVAAGEIAAAALT